MQRTTFAVLWWLVSLLAIPVSAAENVVFVTWDGFRWQELFEGADGQLLHKTFGGVADVDALRSAWWRDTPEARRKVLLPFIWSVLAEQGQILGDPSRNAAAQVTNGKKFSYPGYNEMFAGFADDRIDSNNKIPNPNLTVLEFLERRPGFGGRVAAFATWDVIEFVLNRERSGITVRVGWNPIQDEPLTPGQQRINQLVEELPRLWRGNEYDFLTYQAAREHLLKHKPRVLYIGLGETDEWAHARRYDLYLEAAHRADRYLRELWETLQSLPEYRDQTTLIVTTDHGRGKHPSDWTNHGKETPECEFIWAAALGPRVPARGVREGVNVTQSQFAATLAEAVGEDFLQAVPHAAPPIPWR